eukprot:CAMPEP_0180131726 /NCGR_PEP_ID=MMETSP0986-20121125/8578_2 /TAXON_ID=697907 /ORGANISM="non described non described, Strain CCMP2293" /LENGTH=68 /DNA_ID=CAMNT_0022071631 /DNA_START=281 /DNA_END=484 /DNA_ORIENTATION=-
MTNLMSTTGTATAVAVSASATIGSGPPLLGFGVLGGDGTRATAAGARMGWVPARATGAERGGGAARVA